MGKTESGELLPINLRLIDGSSILLLGQIVLKGNSNLCQLLFAFRFLTVFQYGAEVVHALLNVACYYLVQSETSRVIELFEEVRHEVLQKPVLIIEL